MRPSDKKVIDTTLFDLPRYKEKPVLLLFEIYILDVIEQLTPEKRDGIQKIDVQAIFKTKANHWKPALKEVLQLSSTIEIAILYDWCNSLKKDSSLVNGNKPEEYASNLADRYFEDDSTIDVWTTHDLDEARECVEKYKKNL